MRWNTLLALMIVIIIIIGGTIIIIIFRMPVPPIPGPEPGCPQCGMLKWLGVAQVLVALGALFGLGKLKEEIKNDINVR